MKTTDFLISFENTTKVTIEINKGIEYEGTVAYIPFRTIKNTKVIYARIGEGGDLIITIE